MQAGNPYPSGRLVPFLFLGLAYVPSVETRFPELAVSFLDFSPYNFLDFAFVSVGRILKLTG